MAESLYCSISQLASSIHTLRFYEALLRRTRPSPTSTESTFTFVSGFFTHRRGDLTIQHLKSRSILACLTHSLNSIPTSSASTIFHSAGTARSWIRTHIWYRRGRRCHLKTQPNLSLCRLSVARSKALQSLRCIAFHRSHPNATATKLTHRGWVGSNYRQRRQRPRIRSRALSSTNCGGQSIAKRVPFGVATLGPIITHTSRARLVHSRLSCIWSVCGSCSRRVQRRGYRCWC